MVYRAARYACRRRDLFDFHQSLVDLIRVDWQRALPGALC
jgi:hypothetical protein